MFPRGDLRGSRSRLPSRWLLATASALHPLLARRPEKNVLLIVLSGDRGLCGAFNTNVSKAAFLTWRAKKEAGADVQIATIGKKGRDYLNRRRANVSRDFPKLYDGPPSS